jgi:putative hemolysin
MDNIWLYLVVVVVLTLANGMFAASEIAIVSVRCNRLQQRADAGSRNARIVLRL